MSKEPDNIAAVLHALGAPLTVETRPISTPGAGEILVRNHAIAINPIDWKRQALGFLVSSYPLILGSDISGEVVAVGPSVTTFKPGDRVFSWAHSFHSKSDDNAGFQTYTVVKALASGRLPDNLTYEQGTLLLRMGPASVVLFHDLEFPLPTSLNPAAEQPSSILIWGGATANGTMMVQLARFIGLTVFATASKANHEYVKSLGATDVFDYHSPSVVEDIVGASNKAGKPIHYAVDIIAELPSLGATAEILLKSGGSGSKLAHLLPWPQNEPKPNGLTLSAVTGPRLFDDRKDIANWLYGDGFLVSAVDKGIIVPSPRIQVVKGGINALQTGLDIAKKGVSATRVVVTLDG
ncbi:chaperonin 10-like protein [Xylogone sp. PMI_703]|nr:chaperonin 10-like protein [Xylogone sp. PMI_703]